MRQTAALCCCIFAALTVLVDARYRFKAGFLSFSNPSNTDSNGAGCDPFDNTCEYVFRFCLSEGQLSNCVLGSIVTSPHYITGSSHTFTLGQPLIPGTSAYSNPLVYRDVIASGNPWPANVNFRVQVEDYDFDNSNDLVDRLVLLQGSLLPSETTVREVTVTGSFGKVTMTVQLNVECEEHFFGDNCFTYCTGRNDSDGYYGCDPNGVRMCLDGYTGLPNCLDFDCSPACVNGDCIAPNTCSCLTGWTGAHCDECVLDPHCPSDRATCSVPGSCDCIQGYSGLLCQNDDDVCGHVSPCINGGTCNNAGPNDYTCTCLPGYTGRNCSEEVDACTVKVPCQNGASCTATGPGTYTCSCATGWTGPDCDTNIDECSSNPPCVRGTCMDCEPTGPALVDPNDPNFVYCPNGYICDCPAGFFGANCDIDVDACLPEPCVNGGMCEDVVGGPGYTCSCPPGYTGTNCEVDVDECSSSPTPCLNGGTCINGDGYFNCSCPGGFHGDTCEVDVDECLTAGCWENTTISCVNGPGSFTCHCHSGYTGTLCDEEVDLCMPNPCHNGNCIKSFNDFSCDCFPGFVGVECDIVIDYCVNPEVCLNGGTCVDGVTTYTCNCPPLFTGAQCETLFDPCEPFPCGGGQGCIVEDNGYICEDCNLLAEDPTMQASGCTPSIINPDAARGNNTAPIDGVLIGGVIGGLVGALLLLLLVIAIIFCCIKFCFCCLPVKETQITDPETLPRNGAQQNPLYLGTNTLLSSPGGTMRSAYGSTTPTRVESPTHRTYERLGNSSSSNEDNIDLGPVQNPMYSVVQATHERNGLYQAPDVPPRNSPPGMLLADNVSYGPVPSNSHYEVPSNSHYEVIPALQAGAQPTFVASGKYDKLTKSPAPTVESSFDGMKSGKYDSLALSAPSPTKQKSGKRDSLSVEEAIPPTVENPYVLSPQSEAVPPELRMAPSERGDMYAMLPPMTAFASIKEETNNKKMTAPQEDSQATMPATNENPYDFS